MASISLKLISMNKQYILDSGRKILLLLRGPWTSNILLEILKNILELKEWRASKPIGNNKGCRATTIDISQVNVILISSILYKYVFTFTERERP
jgi:hypothetical protein